MKVILSPSASADIQRLYHFLKDKNPDAARRAVAALENAARSLEFMPQRGRPAGNPNLRELVVPFGRSAYILRYAFFSREDEVVVLRIWHGRELRE